MPAAVESGHGNQRELMGFRSKPQPGHHSLERLHTEVLENGDRQAEPVSNEILVWTSLFLGEKEPVNLPDTLGQVSSSLGSRATNHWTERANRLKLKQIPWLN